MADFDDIQSYKTDTNYEKDLSVSARLEKAKNSTDWGSFYANLNMNDVLKASKDPVNRIYNVQDLENITSDAGTIAYDTFRKGVLDLASIGDKAEMALGNTLAGISGDSFGTEMRNRAYDNLMKTMEDSQFIDSNYGDAETWTARFVGGGMSYAEMAAIGFAAGPVGLGAFVGALSLSDGALNDMAKYEEEHGNLDGYETDPVNLALDYGNAIYQIGSELIGGTGRLLNGRVLKAGRTGTAIIKEYVINFLQESTQGAVADLTEVLKGNQDLDILIDNFVGYMKDGTVAGTLGAGIGGGFYKINKGRAIESIDKINQKLHPEMSEQERQELNEDIFAKTEEQSLKSFAPQIIAHAEAVNDKGAIRDNIQKKVEFMYRDAEDMSEKQKAQAVEATTTVELENILYDSIERKIPLTAHPLLKGEINELGWFRDGIPANRRTEIDSLNNELVELRRQQRELNQAQEKDYEKLEELETKIEQFQKDLPEKIKDLVVADRAELKDMLDKQRQRVREQILKREQARKLNRRVKQIREAIDKTQESARLDRDKLAEQMASGAEKARARRVIKETLQQTREAKQREKQQIKTLKEQREISSAIKNLKVKTKEDKLRQATERRVAIREASDESLRAALTSRGWMPEIVRRMKRRELIKAVRDISGVQISELVRRASADSIIEQSQEEQPKKKIKTAKGFFHKSINKQFANDSGIMQAWGYNSKDSAVNLVFVKDGGISDWDGIVQALQDEGYIPGTYDESYAATDATTDIAKDIVLNNRELGDVSKTRDVEADISQADDLLMELGYTQEQLNNMDYQDRMDILAAKYGEEVDGQEIDVDAIPDDFMPQSKVSGKGKDDYRGAYIPEYRFIVKTANLDASTLAHELAHDWGQENFRWARSGRASEDFMKAWGAVEKAIGITDKDTYFTYAASEKFARAYEGWLMQRKDWADILKINNDDERKAVADAMEDYRQQIVDIYESLNHKYFKMAWGKVGELKPELQEWFDRSNKFDSLDARVARGEITEEKAAEEKLGDMVVAATDASINSLSTQDLQAVDAIEQLDKYEQQLKETAKQFEVEGGNINRLQKRLDDIALAKNMIANNAALKRHDTHRDMIKAAEAADEFVRTRLEDALAIINGKMAEQDDIYASELYTALERLATEQNDYNLINELRNSKVATDLAKELGQRVAGFRNYKGDGDLDIMSALKSLDKQYEKAYNDKAKEQVDTEIKALESELAQQDKTADAKLDDFLKEMECQ